jgi:hypothetical protein
MDCLRSFVIGMQNASTYSGGDVKTWTVGSQVFWALNESGTSLFNFEGFKNVDVYGIDVIGGVGTQQAAGIGGVVVSDWNFEVRIEGNLPLVSGLVQASGNFWGITTEAYTTKVFRFSKNTNSLKFSDPIQSVKNLEFLLLRTEGQGAETTGTVSIDYDFSFIVFYKYEGE